jgi:hypothetical protein
VLTNGALDAISIGQPETETLPSLQEIAIVAVIVGVIILLPRITRSPQSKTIPHPVLRLTAAAVSGRLRLAILSSAVWLALVAAYFKPWRDTWFAFLFGGVGPVVLCWGIAWVVNGFRKRNR